jgi:hypothetical protein
MGYVALAVIKEFGVSGALMGQVLSAALVGVFLGSYVLWVLAGRVSFVDERFGFASDLSSQGKMNVCSSSLRILRDLLASQQVVQMMLHVHDVIFD